MSDYSKVRGLKPCPLCGGDRFETRDTNSPPAGSQSGEIRCVCGLTLSGDCGERLSSVNQKWNRRALSSLPVRSGEVENLRPGSAPIGSIMDPINPEEEAELLAAGAPDTWTAARQARRQTYLYCADVAGSVYVRDLEAHFRKCAEQVPDSSAALAPPPQAQEKGEVGRG